MCSTPVQRIARAIDEMAVQADAARVTEAVGNESVHVLKRLAELWALLAELDPEVAKRLRTYQG